MKKHRVRVVEGDRQIVLAIEGNGKEKTVIKAACYGKVDNSFLGTLPARFTDGRKLRVYDRGKKKYIGGLFA